MIKNSYKGYITSTIGLLILLSDGIYFLRINEIIGLPDCPPIQSVFNASVLFLIGLAMFLIPETKLEEKLNSFIDKKLNNKPE